MEQNLSIIIDVQGGQVAEARITGVSQAVEGVGKSSQETQKQTSNLRQRLGDLATGFAVYKGASFIKGAITETTNLAKATAGLSRITGMDAKTASGWVGVAQERGIQSKALNQGFITLSKNLTSAQHGGKAATDTFRQLGISQAALANMSTQEAVGKLSDAFAKLPNGADKATLAQKLFGRQAQAMLPLLNQGSDALNGQIGAMGKHTGMTNESLKSQLELVKAQREWNAAMLGLKVAVATALVPVITALLKLLMPLIQGFSSLMQSSTAFRVAVVAITAALVIYVATMKIARLANIAFMASAAPWAALAVAIAVALVMLYQKCAWFHNAVNAAFGGVVAAFRWVKNAAQDTFRWISHNWPLLVSILGGPIAAAAVQIATHWGQIKNTAVAAFNAIKSAAQAVGSVVGSVLGGAFRAVSSAIQGVVSGINDIVNAAQKIAKLPSKALNAITGGVSSAASAVNPFGQHGLYASQSGTAIVGEAGPEMVTLPQGARVSPTVSSYGGREGRVVVPVYLDRRQIALALGSYTADQQAAR